MNKFKKIYVEITNICNRQCTFCSIDNKKKKEMSLSEFEHILIEIRPMTNYIYLHVKGEPLLHSDLEEILLLCKKYEMKVNITTNGTLLHRRAEDIIKSGVVRQINLSMHQFESGMDEYVDNILATVTDILHHTDIVIVYRFWALKDFQLSEDNQKILDKIVTYYHISSALLHKIKTEKNVKLDHNLYINKAQLFTWPSMDEKYIDSCGFCYGLKSHIGILADGTVVPCCLDSSGIIELGNIFEESFQSILEKDKTKEIIKGFRENKIIEPLCQRCDYRLRFSKCQKM